MPVVDPPAPVVLAAPAVSAPLAVLAQQTVVPDQAVVPEPVPVSNVPVVAPPTPVPLPTLAMDQVQPILTRVLQSLQSGQGEKVLQWLEPASRQSPSASNFVVAYQQKVAGSRITGLGPVRFTSRQSGDQLVVDGIVQLWLQDSTQQTTRHDWRLRATFLARESGPVLARLEVD